jgi:hypothetical protein
LILRARPAAALLALGLLLSTACHDTPTEPSVSLEVVPASGNGQYAPPSSVLEEPLAVLVRRVDTGAPQEGIQVSWSVASGDASFVSGSVTTTGADGVTSATVRVGGTVGAVEIVASIHDQPDASATFTAHVVEPPTLTELSSTSATAGDTLTLTGSGFSSTARQNAVLFSGIRGEVLEAQPTTLRVVVPPCLPTRSVAVTVQLGTLVSEARDLAVSDAGRFTVMDTGESLDVDDLSGGTCVRLQGGGPYLVDVMSTGTVGAGRYGYAFRGLVDGGGVTTAAPPPSPRATRPAGYAQRFEEALRLREDTLARTSPRAVPGESPWGAAAAVPAVGHHRSFKVLNADNGFDDVSAVARVVSDQAVIYLDETAPSGGFSDADLQEFASAFDDVIYPTDTNAFGMPSDLDGNERVVILFTPAVNRLTPRGSDGFVGGFFYGLDLLDRDGSNHAEIFYALVPDPAGVYSDPRSADRVKETVPAILAHEFQHMIHFNERVLKRGAAGTEALWLSEGLAQMAEELVGRAYLARGNALEAQRYRDGDEDRARRYLARPDTVSLIVSTGQGSLPERGAGWLFTLYLWDRWDKEATLRSLTQSLRTGVTNVGAVTGLPWPEVFSDWAAALALNHAPTGVHYDRDYPTVNLRARIRDADNAYPLHPEGVGKVDFERSGRLWSSSVHYYIVEPPTGGSAVLSLGGEGGGAIPDEAGLRLRIVRAF